MSTTHTARRDCPSPSATALARALLDTGWQLTGAAVRVINTVYLSDGSDLTVTVSCEAGQVRLELDSEYRNLNGLTRPAWHAEATGELPADTLSAVAIANIAASTGTPAEAAEKLTAAGWAQPHPLGFKWISPDTHCEVTFTDDELQDNPLPWVIRRTTARPVTILASTDTPAAVIVALAICPVR